MRQFLRATTTAVVRAFQSMDAPEAIGFTLNGAKGVLQATFGRRDNALGAERMAHCHQCPMFDHELKTCGTPGNVIQDEEDPDDWCMIGCWCYLPYAAPWVGKTCYLNNKNLEGGWKR